MLYKENPELEDDMIEALFRRWRKGKFLLARPQRQIYENIASKVTGAEVCDIGSGSGLGTVILAQEAQSVVGIEKVAGSVKFSKKCFPLKNVRFLNEDIVKSSLATKSFDMVVAVEVIEHIADYRGALVQMSRILRRPGTLYISSPNRNSKDMGPPRSKYHVREWTAGEFRDALLCHFGRVDLYDHTLAHSLTDKTATSPIVAICQVG